jgi:hypothetical protein
MTQPTTDTRQKCLQVLERAGGAGGAGCGCNRNVAPTKVAPVAFPARGKARRPTGSPNCLRVSTPPPSPTRPSAYMQASHLHKRSCSSKGGRQRGTTSGCESHKGPEGSGRRHALHQHHLRRGGTVRGGDHRLHATSGLNAFGPWCRLPGRAVVRALAGREGKRGLGHEEEATSFEMGESLCADRCTQHKWEGRGRRRGGGRRTFWGSVVGTCVRYVVVFVAAEACGWAAVRRSMAPLRPLSATVEIGCPGSPAHSLPHPLPPSLPPSRPGLQGP